MIRSKQQEYLEIFAYVIMIIVAVMILYPFLLLFMSSLTDEVTLSLNGYSVIPKKFSLKAYAYIWNARATIFRAYGVTICVTFVGTLLNVYADFAEEFLAIPVVRGKKTDKEKFAGAIATYTIEALMHDGKALQCGTSHNFGDGFARAFEIQYVSKDNKPEYCHQTSWGMTTRMIGAIIMVHGDDSGLKLPPRVAPVQAMVIPIQQKKGNVLEKACELKDALCAAGIRARLDDSDKSPGWKFSDQEMRGIPVRLELGPKDIEQGQCVIVRRDTREKIVAPLEGIGQKVCEVLEQIQNDMFEAAKSRMESMTYTASSKEEFKEIADTKPGFIRSMWCGCRECEEEIKDQLGGVTSRCMPFEQEHLADTCIWCGKPAKTMIYWGKAY